MGESVSLRCNEQPVGLIFTSETEAVQHEWQEWAGSYPPFHWFYVLLRWGTKRTHSHDSIDSQSLLGESIQLPVADETTAKQFSALITFC